MADSFVKVEHRHECPPDDSVRSRCWRAIVADLPSIADSIVAETYACGED